MNEQLSSYLKDYFKLEMRSIQLLESKISIEPKSKKDFLVKADCYSKDFYLILDGFVRTYYTADDGAEVTTDILGKGEMTSSYYSILKNAPAFENIQCITDCFLCSISENDLEEIALLDPAWYQVSLRFLKATVLKKEERLYSFAKLTAKERYMNLVNQRPDIVQNVPVRYVASFLGIHPESLSRIRGQHTFS